MKTSRIHLLAYGSAIAYIAVAVFFFITGSSVLVLAPMMTLLWYTQFGALFFGTAASPSPASDDTTAEQAHE